MEATVAAQSRSRGIMAVEFVVGRRLKLEPCLDAGAIVCVVVLLDRP